MIHETGSNFGYGAITRGYKSGLNSGNLQGIRYLSRGFLCRA
jgi:hypothetical protein